MSRPTVAISIGCPSGVGPEVSVVGAARVSEQVRCVLVGSREVILRAAKLRRVAASRIVPVRDARGVKALGPRQIGWWEGSTDLAAPPYGAPSREAGAAQLAWIDEATDVVRAGIAEALVTGPVSKAAIAKSGAPGAEVFRGHTEHLAARLGAPEVIMAFAGEALVTALVTTHLAIAEVPRALTPEAVASTTFWLAHLVAALRRRGRGSKRLGEGRTGSPLGLDLKGSAHAKGRASRAKVAPLKLAVASLNPHAGESGLLGREEIETIGPGVKLARERLAEAGVAAEITGPIGAETAIRYAAKGIYDGVVAMYHDQATIPSKLLGFGEAVNVTLALPIVRTSVDHGTGYDVAGTGRADARGMIEAIRVAVRLVESRRAGRSS